MENLPLPDMAQFDVQANALAWMFSHLVTYLRGGARPEPVATFADGAAALRVIDALVASSEAEKWLDIGLG